MQVPINTLFLAGLGIGLLTSASYVLVILLRVWLNPALAPLVRETVPLRTRLAALKEAAPVIVLMVGVLGGLFGGLFTATQAGAVGAFLSLVVALGQRSIGLRGLRLAVTETLVTCGSLFVVIIGTSMLTLILTRSGIGGTITDVVGTLGASPVLLLVAIACIYLVLGLFLEPIGAMLITLPILLPLVDGAGISLIWFGVFVVKLLEIGMITRPDRDERLCPVLDRRALGADGHRVPRHPVVLCRGPCPAWRDDRLSADRAVLPRPFLTFPKGYPMQDAVLVSTARTGIDRAFRGALNATLFAQHERPCDCPCRRPRRA